MASEAVIDLDEILKPISDDNPVGEDIREDSSPTSPYNSIKDARSAARSAERKNMFEANNSEASEKWREVMELAADILKNMAKDLDAASLMFTSRITNKLCGTNEMKRSVVCVRTSTLLGIFIGNNKTIPKIKII